MADQWTDPRRPGWVPPPEPRSPRHDQPGRGWFTTIKIAIACSALIGLIVVAYFEPATINASWVVIPALVATALVDIARIVARSRANGPT
jgi:hypothetical protein